jgi:putative alpha-1,2-mannosidase
MYFVCLPENKYIQTAMLNNVPINDTYINHSDVMNGGTLLLTLGEKPNRSWGTTKAPPSPSDM